MKTADPPDKMDRSTVSPTFSLNPTRRVCKSSVWLDASDAAIRASPGPIRVPRPGCASMTKSSAANAVIIRCTVDRAKSTLCAISVSVRPSGRSSSTRKMLAARAMTCTPPWLPELSSLRSMRRRNMRSPSSGAREIHDESRAKLIPGVCLTFLWTVTSTWRNEKIQKTLERRRQSTVAQALPKRCSDGGLSAWPGTDTHVPYPGTNGRNASLQ